VPKPAYDNDGARRANLGASLVARLLPAGSSTDKALRFLGAMEGLMDLLTSLDAVNAYVDQTFEIFWGCALSWDICSTARGLSALLLC